MPEPPATVTEINEGNMTLLVDVFGHVIRRRPRSPVIIDLTGIPDEPPTQRPCRRYNRDEAIEMHRRFHETLDSISDDE